MNDRQEYKKAAMIAFGASWMQSTRPLADFNIFCAKIADDMVKEDRNQEEREFRGLRNSQDPMSSALFGNPR